MAVQYYYFISGLPDISFEDSRKAFTLNDFRDELKKHLSAEDYQLAEIFFLKYDNKNIINLLEKKNEKFNELALFSLSQTEDEIKRIKDEGISPKGLFPLYLQHFVASWFDESAEKSDLSAENRLALAYYDYAFQSKNRFVQEYFRFEMTLLNILTALYSRKYKLDYEKEILGDDDLAQTIKKSNAKDFNIAGEFGLITQLLQISELTDVLEREKRIDQLRWKHIDDSIFFYYFTVERILAYLLKLEISNRWIGLSKDEGKKRFETITGNIKSEFEFPQEYQKK